MKKTIISRLAVCGASALLLGSSAFAAERNYDNNNNNNVSNDRNAQHRTTDVRDPQQRGQLSAKDYKFIREATQGGMAEVELGEMARLRGSNQGVKDFGARMVKDHQQANKDLQEIASRKGASLPASLAHHDSSLTTTLQKAQGADFDKKYIDAMVKDHDKDVKEFQDAAQNSDDADIKAFAQKTLPTLQEHDRMAKQLQNTVSGTAANK